MKTIEASIGEIIEAMYEEVLETYGDRELALVVAQSFSDELFMDAARERRAPRAPFVLPADLAARAARSCQQFLA